MDTIQLIAEISVLKKKMDKAEAFLEELVEYLLVTCKDDDYITPEVICRKLAKYGYIELENGYWVNPLADRKTENSSEKPNNCEKDCFLYRSTTSVEDEPQTDTEIAKAIVHKMIDDAVIAEDAYPDLRQKMHDAVDEYEPQTECDKHCMQTEVGCESTDCAWRKGE